MSFFDSWADFASAPFKAGKNLLMGDNPYDEASKYYNQIPGKISPYFDPYIQAGRGAMGDLQGQYGQLTHDPAGMYSKLGQGYQQSPGYGWQLNQGMNAANNAAAAGGMAGSPQHQQQAATMAEGLANQDYYNYMKQVMGMYGMGLGGESNINQMGYNASNELAGGLGRNLMNQGNMAFSGAAAGNQQFGNILGDLAAFAMFL